MLAILGFLTVILLLAAVMSKKLSPTAALISVPLVTGIIASFFIKNDAGVVDFWSNIKKIMPAIEYYMQSCYIDPTGSRTFRPS